MTNALDDDEWEYEYDENETEDFYISLDLSNVPQAQGPVSTAPKAGHPTLLKSRLRALQAGRTQPELPTDSSDAQDPAASVGEIQITGFHTSNPLIMYNGQLLSCHWASTIGTDMFFTKPSADDSTLDQPLRSLPSVDLLAIGSAKLIAKAGGLLPRDDLIDKMDERDEGKSTVHQREVQPAGTEVPQPPTDDQETATRELPPAPQSFLAKLNEAKAKRGETSRLAVSQTSTGSRLISKVVDMQPSTAEPRHQTRPEEDIEMSGT